MKILHVVTFIDQDRSYGGPVTVAMNLAEEQVRQGHQVTIFSLAPTSSDRKAGFSSNGVDFVLFRARHLPFLGAFSSMVSIPSFYWLLSHAKSFDVAHLHFSRDLFQGLSARVLGFLKLPVFLQTHGMITNSETKEKRIQNFYDTTFVKPVLQQARQVFALQKVELTEIKAKFGIAHVRLLPNGVQMASHEPSKTTESTLVAFVSRLHPRKNPILFLQCAKRMIESGFTGRFVIAGPDGGLGDQVSQFVSNFNHPHLEYLGPLSHSDTLSLLKRISVLVLPSRNEPFPMIVLEALSVGTPVAISRSCQIADLVVHGGLGVVFDESAEGVEAGIHEVLARNVSRTSILQSATQIFGISKVVSELLKIYDA